MNPEDLSDDAIRLYLAHFLNPKSTLRFGGDHAQKEITPRAREALDQLLEIGAAQTIEPDDQWPNREHYGSTGMDLRDQLRQREHLNPFKDTEEFITFRNKSDVSNDQDHNGGTVRISFGSP